MSKIMQLALFIHTNEQAVTLNVDGCLSQPIKQSCYIVGWEGAKICSQSPCFVSAGFGTNDFKMPQGALVKQNTYQQL